MCAYNRHLSYHLSFTNLRRYDRGMPFSVAIIVLLTTMSAILPVTVLADTYQYSTDGDGFHTLESVTTDSGSSGGSDSNAAKTDTIVIS